MEIEAVKTEYYSLKERIKSYFKKFWSKGEIEQ